MAYLIDETYFQRQYYVPNVEELNSRSKEDLLLYIDQYVRLCLQDALGYVLFKDLDTYIVNGNLEPNAPQKWLNLVNGAEYTEHDRTYYWKGLKYNEGAFKVSLLTPFVFYHWLLDNQAKMSGMGEVVLEAKNAINASSNQRLTKSWNTFVQLYQDKNYHYNNCVWYYEGVRVIDWMENNTNNDFVSLVKFLYDNKEDYPDANITTYKFKNQFGL